MNPQDALAALSRHASLANVAIGRPAAEMIQFTKVLFDALLERDQLLAEKAAATERGGQKAEPAPSS